MARFPIQTYSEQPIPFSGVGIPYYLGIFQELMVRMNAAEQGAGIAHTDFWGYQITPDALAEQPVADMEGEIVWDYKTPPPPAGHGKPPDVPVGTWAVNPWGAGEPGRGYMAAPNLIEQVRLALIRLLEARGMNPGDLDSVWTEGFKEVSGVRELNGLGAMWGNYRRSEPNLTTDHVELMRLSPRSLVHVAAGGKLYQADGRLTIPAGFPALPMSRMALPPPFPASGAVALIEGEIAGEWFHLGTGRVSIWQNNRWDPIPVTGWLDACHWSRPITGQGSEGLIGLTTSGLEVIAWDGLTWNAPVSIPMPTMPSGAVAYDPDGSTDSPGVRMLGPTPITLSGCRALDLVGSTLILAGPGTRFQRLLYDGSTLATRSGGRLGFIAQGICAERRGGLAAEDMGEDNGKVRILASELPNRIHAVDLEETPGLASVDMQWLTSPPELRISPRARFMYRDGVVVGAEPMSGAVAPYRLSFNLSAQWRALKSEVAGDAFHSLWADSGVSTGRPVTLRHFVWDLPMTAPSSPITPSSDDSWTVPGTRTDRVQGANETFDLIGVEVAGLDGGQWWVLPYYMSQTSSWRITWPHHNDSDDNDPIPLQSRALGIGHSSGATLSYHSGPTYLIWEMTGLDARLQYISQSPSTWKGVDDVNGSLASSDLRPGMNLTWGSAFCSVGLGYEDDAAANALDPARSYYRWDIAGARAVDLAGFTGSIQAWGDM